MTELAAGGRIEPVWRNQLGGWTYRLGDGADARFVKWSPHGTGIDLDAEAERLRWASPRVTVPTILDEGADDAGGWIVTLPVAGRSAVDDRWKADPRTAARAIGTGLRRMHENLPVESCPFSWATEHRIEIVHQRADAGLLRPERWHRDHRRLTVAPARPPGRLPRRPVRAQHADRRRRLGHRPRRPRLARRRRPLGRSRRRHLEHGVELRTGVGGRTARRYGIDPDPERTDWFRLLWELGP